MVSKNSFTLLVVSSTPFFAFVQIIYFLDSFTLYLVNCFFPSDADVVVSRSLSTCPEKEKYIANLQSWTLISRHYANVPKVLIFGLLVRTGTKKYFSY